jgi:agmatinase
MIRPYDGRSEAPTDRAYSRRVPGSRYRPLDAQVIPRFAGIRTFMRAPHVTDVDGVDAVVYGIPFDTATSYRTGARYGPEAIRSASALIRPYHQSLAVNVVEALSVVDYGDLPVSPGDTERTYAQVQEALTPVVDAGVFPVALGGDHSITLAELRVLAKRHGPLALVQLDSHCDTWEQYFGQRYFHGTTFKRAVEEGLLDASASVQAGMRGPVYDESDLAEARELGFTVVESEALRSLGVMGYAALVSEKVGDRPVFVSFDIDFLDPAFAPGTGTPEVAGFSTAEAVAFLRSLRGITLVGCDVVEVCPAYDGAGQPTALAAANIAFELLALRALSTRRS